jgi:2',3'-cyclic-nucleotide 2'-phosphodiesterase (5'-nucleotidase family)
VWSAADFAALEAGLVDDDTYIQQGRELEVKYGDAVMNYILGTLQPDTDLALVGYPFTDEVSHQFLALTVPTDIDGDPNPFYDDADGNHVADGRVGQRKAYIRSAYREADRKLALARSLLNPGSPSSVTTVATSDHGFATQWWAINARKVLYDTQITYQPPGDPLPPMQTVRLQESGASTASNCGATTTDLTKACWAGGTNQVYINTTLPAGLTAAVVRQAVVNAFNGLTDPAYPGKQVLSAVMVKEQLKDVDGVDALHPNRSGDVVVVSRPPYQWDAPTAGQRIAWSHFYGQHGYLPDLVKINRSVNMHGTFVASGPGFLHSTTPIAGVRSIDLAPTLSLLMGIPGPQNARGHVLMDTIIGGTGLSEVTILQISDWHGQLIPLSDAPDTLPASAPLTFAIGGGAFLKPWFDWYEDDANGDTFRMSAGDTVGATPPISSFFDDEPAIETMNDMGIDIDGIGNHNFDAGQAHWRNDLIPLANFPIVSSNVVDGTSHLTPAEWSPSHTFTTTDGLKIGFIGFSNDDLPDLTSPAAVSPFVVEDALTHVNVEAANLTTAGVDIQVVMGHMGATAGTLSAPTGPGVTLADGVLSSVDAVLGDHTDIQALSPRPNGVLFTESRSKGLRFTRVELFINKVSGQVVYKTANWHKPWDIGVTPDPTIQARIDGLNAQLAPILNTQIGTSTVFIPRSDNCGQSAGRLCESLVGNLVTDAMRNTYGTEFAITNSGGLRSDETCPTTDIGGDFCPAYTPPPYPITRGQNLTLLPFGNVVVTLTVNGAELKTMLENGVGGGSPPFPGVQGRFPQVSGLCFTFDVAQPALSRVTGAVRQAANGSCTGAAIDLTASGGPYTIAENDFMMNGGDGYPNFSARATSRDIMENDVAEYITAQPSSQVSPSIQGRIVCTDTNGATAPDCPAPIS